MNISKFQKCANCGACYNICPTKAIFIEEKEIFYKVKVDESKCVNCGLCYKVCPVNNKIKPHLKETEAYWGYCLDKEVVKRSSSGGIFSVLAENIKEEGGIVFSSIYTDDFKKVVISNSDMVDIELMRRSKYVESCVEASFVEIKTQLEKSRKVLFCGTPCQVAGLKTYLEKDYANLFTVDFLCGGLASHEMYKNHLKQIEKQYKSKVINVNFRPKSAGWEEHVLLIELENGKKYEMPMALDPYFYSFVNAHLSVREYCYECKFANKRLSDLTLADFWKYRKVAKLSKNKKGLSQIYVNTHRGASLLKKVVKHLCLNKIDFQMVSDDNERRATQSTMEKRNIFIETYEKEGLAKAAIKAGMPINKQKAIILKHLIKKAINR